jgi:hypothetical protein
MLVVLWRLAWSKWGRSITVERRLALQFIDEVFEEDDVARVLLGCAPRVAGNGDALTSGQRRTGLPLYRPASEQHSAATTHAAFPPRTCRPLPNSWPP